MKTLSTTHSSVDFLREPQVGGTLLLPHQTQDAPVSVLDGRGTLSPVGVRRFVPYNFFVNQCSYYPAFLIELGLATVGLVLVLGLDVSVGAKGYGLR